MALKYEVSPERKLITVTAMGTVGRDDINDLQTSLLADNRILSEMGMLVDANGAEPHLSFTDLQEISKPLQQMFEKGIARMAIVAGSTFVYSLARTFGVFAERLPVRVRPFREVSHAVAWLESAS